MQYSTGKHCVFYHRYHLVWSTKYRYKVLRGDIKLRVRDICRQVCAENGVDIIRGVLSNDHVHMFVSVPPKLAISDLMRLMKGRSSYKVQREFPHLKKRYWGQRFWGVGSLQLQTVPSLRTSYFSTCKRISKILPTPVSSCLVEELIMSHILDTSILADTIPSYAQKLVTDKLGGVLKLLDPVLELNPLNDFGQSIGAAELSPFLLG